MAVNKCKKDVKDNIKSYYDLMKDEQLQELEVGSKDFHLFIKRKGNISISYNQPRSVSNNETLKAFKDENNVKKSEVIKSPITGVFYKAASPTSPAFVKEGDVVDTGATLCIVEAMKTMNEIKATFKTKILKVLIENGNSVKAGDDLFEIEKL